MLNNNLIIDKPAPTMITHALFMLQLFFCSTPCRFSLLSDPSWPFPQCTTSKFKN